MSFINSITGNIPHSELIITETNVSADNASFTNISAVNASFINLSTTTFTPVNVNSSTINVSNLNVSNSNMSILNISTAHVSDLIINELELINLSVDNISNDIIDTEVINIKSNNNLLPNGQIRKLNNDVLLKLGDITDIGTFSIQPNGSLTKLNFNDGLLTINNSIHTSYIHISNMSLDGTLGGNTVNVVNVNANYVNVNNISNDYINTNTIVCDVLGAFQSFSSTSGSIATLNGNITTYNTGVITDINSSTLVVSDTASLTDLEVLGTADINTLNVIGANGLTSTKILCNNINGTLINVSTINNSTINSKTSNTSTLNVSNISSSNISTIFNITCNNLKGNIRDNIQAGAGISLVTAGNITTITNTGLVSSPLNVSVINASFITTKTSNASTDNASLLNASSANIITTNTSGVNASNISVSNELSANFLNAVVSIGAPVISSADFIGSAGSFATLNATTTNTSTLNASNVAVFDTLTALDIVASGGFFGDISNNLLAGNNITLTTTGGITTIASTAGGVSDPLNISTLNASKVNASNISVSNELSANFLNAVVSIGAPVISSADFIGSQGSFATLNGTTTNTSTLNASNATITGLLTAPNIEGFTQSTEYGFKAFSTSGNQNAIIPQGGKIDFDTVSTTPSLVVNGYCVPNINDYNTALARYTIPVAGFWAIGCKIKINTVVESVARLAIYKNGVNYSNSGNYAGNSEGNFLTDECVVGDYYEMYVISGSLDIDLRVGGSYFYGFKLSPSNNLITSTTDLQIKSLITTNDITCNGVLTGSGLCNLTTISALNITSSGGIVSNAGITAVDGNITGTLFTNTITNTGTITSSILNGDISNNLLAGSNITLNTTGGITTIASTGGAVVNPYLSVILSTTYIPGTGTSYTFIYDTITAVNGISYNTGTGIATIPSTGVYAISASVNIDDISINARINIRCRLRVNNSWILGYPQSYGYIRNNTEVTYASATIAEWMFLFNQNDTIDIRADVGVGTNTNFTSPFTGLQFFNGAVLTIKKID